MSVKSQKEIEKTLAKEHACYVLITCDPPASDGNMNVQMSYEGDPTLASYLVNGAQSILDGQPDTPQLRLVD